MSNSLQLVLSDFIGDDEINCSVFPENIFGLPDTEGVITEEHIEVLSQFNQQYAVNGVVALPCAIQGLNGVFIAKLDVELSDADRTVYAMFAEPVIEGNHVEALHCQKFVTLLKKV